MRLVALHSLSALTVAVVVGNAILAGWAFAATRRRERLLSRGFWTLLLVVLVLLAVQVAAGIVLAAGGAQPRTSLHFLYGILVTMGGIAQFGLRPGGFLRSIVLPHSARSREARTLALLCLTQAALLFRAYTTGALGR